MNSKKLTALLSFVLVMVASLVLSGCHMHTFDVKFSNDENAHWYAANCGCDLKGNYAEHVDEDNDHLCDLCGYDEGHADTDHDDLCDGCGAALEHKHLFSEDWTSDNQYHWHEAICGCAMIKDKTAHFDEDINEACDACGAYVKHEHTMATEYSYDNNNHWYAYACGCDGEFETAPHVNENGDVLCDVCGFEMYEVVTSHFDTNDVGAATYEEDTAFGIFTVGAGTQVRDRKKTLNGVTYPRSVKVNGSTAAFYVNAGGPGMLTMIIQNGSSSADTQILKMYTPGSDVAVSLEYPGKASDNPMYKMEIAIEEAGAYKFQCSGTTDIYDAIFTSIVKKGDHTTVTATLCDDAENVLGTVSVYDGTILNLSVLLEAIEAPEGYEIDGVYTDKDFAGEYVNGPIYSNTKLYVKLSKVEIPTGNKTYTLTINSDTVPGDKAPEGLTLINDIFYMSQNVKGEDVRIDGLTATYSRQISLTSGKVTTAANGIVFTVDEGTYATVTLVAAAKSDKTISFKILNADGAAVVPADLAIGGVAAADWDTLPIDTANTYTFTLEAGTYHLGGSGGGAYVYALTAEICPVKPATTVYTLTINSDTVPGDKAPEGLTLINDIFYMSQNVKGEDVRIDGLTATYSRQISLTSGKVTTAANGIVFTVDEGTYATVTLVAAAKSDKTISFKILNADGAAVVPADLAIGGVAAADWDTLPIDTANTYTFTLEAGTYHLGGANGGAYVYALSVEF